MQNPILTPPKLQNLITRTKFKPRQHAALKQALQQRHNTGIKLGPRGTQPGPEIQDLAPGEDGSTQPINNAPGGVVIQFRQHLFILRRLSFGGSLELKRYRFVGGEAAGAEIVGGEGVKDEDGGGADLAEEELGEEVGAVGGDGGGEGGEEGGGGGEGEDVGGVAVGS